MADFTRDFSALTTTNPYVLSSPLKFMYGGTSGTTAADAFQVVNGSGIKISNFGTLGLSWGVHDVTYGNLITSEITIPNNAFSGDIVAAGIFIRSGTGQAAGYVFRVDGFGGGYIQSITATGTLTTLTSTGSGITTAANDVFKLTFDQSTGDLAAYQNGVSKLTVSADNTYTSPQRALMGAGWYTEWGNSNAQYISVFAGTGVSASGTTVNPAAATMAFTGNTPTLTLKVNPSAAAIVISPNTPSISTGGAVSVSPASATYAFTGQTPIITAQAFTWYSLPAPGGYDSNSILAGQTYPIGSWLRVVTDFTHITANYGTGPLQNDINDYSTAAGGYTGSDTATYEIKSSTDSSTSQYTVTANIQQGAISLGPATATLTFTGATPTVSVGSNTTLAPSAAVLTFTGNTPTITATTNQNLLPITANYRFTGFTPLIYINGVPQLVGKSMKRPMKRALKINLKRSVKA